MIQEPLEAQAERLFAEYLRAVEGGAEVDLAALSAGAASEVVERFRAILDDYTLLRRQAWSAGLGLSPGRRIAGYELVRLAGSGACGSVWEAEQVGLGRRVAIKILHPHLHLSDRALARFRQEAAAAARLEHPSIVRVFDAGEEDGVCYLAQELVQGGSLADRIVARRSAPDSARFDDYAGLAETFARIADALDVAHRAGIVHRDVKPANILFDTGGMPRLVDFGLALVGDGQVATWSGSHAGTLAYAAPEQLRGDMQPPDARSDVFSLGATLYEALTLRRAFEGDAHELVLRAVLNEDPPDPRAVRARVPRDLALICLKALEKSPSRRYPTAGELALDLRRFLQDQPVVARPVGRAERAHRWCRRHPAAAAAVAILATCALTVAVLLVATWRAERREARVRGAAEKMLAQVLDGLSIARSGLEARPLPRPAADLLAPAAVLLQQDPIGHARALQACGQVYVANARHRDAALLLEEAHRLLAATYGPTDERSRDALAALALVYEDAWDHELAAAKLADALELELQAGGSSVRRVASLAGRLHRALAREEDRDRIRELDQRVGGLEALLRRAVQDAEPSIEAAVVRASLGRFLLDQERPAEAIAHAEAALEALKRLAGELHAESLRALDLVADVRCALGDHAGSAARYQRLIDLTGLDLRPHRPIYLHALSGKAEELQEQGLLREAEAVYLDAIQKLEVAFGDAGVPVLLTRRAYAILLMRCERFDEALEVLDEIEPTLEEALGRTHLDPLIAARARSTVLHALSRWDEACASLRDQLQRHVEGRGASHHQTLNTLTYLAQNATARGALAEAVSWRRQALEHGAALDERSQAILRAELVTALSTAGELDEARRELALSLSVLGDDHPAVLLARGDLAAAEGDQRTASACYDAWELTDDAARDVSGERRAALAVRRALLRQRVERTDEARAELRAAQASLRPWQVDWRFR